MQPRFLTTVAAVLLVVPALASAADKYLSSMAKPSGFAGSTPPPLTTPLSPAWTNGTSKGKVKVVAGSCKVSGKLTGMALPNSDGTPGTGDEVICLAEFNTTAIGAVGLVLRGEVNNGTVKILADLANEGAIGSFCSGANVIYDPRATCYAPDAAYTGGIILPFTSDPTQGGTAGYPPRPASGLLATSGLFFP